MGRRFHEVDVFGTEPFSGNPLAVVHDAEGLSTEAMQRITRWMNLSETAFLLPPSTPDADYRVRIFTLARELPFAGHPTLGACHAWLEAGGEPQRDSEIVQECGIGLVPLRRPDGRVAFAAPPLERSGPLGEVKIRELTGALGIDRDAVVDAEWVDNGPGWAGLLLGSAEEVLAVESPSSHPGQLDVGLVGPYPDGAECAFEVRALFTDERGGVIEDPVTGSLNASLAQWLLSSGRATAPYVASQGTKLGRSGRVHITQDDDGEIWVGGATTTLVEGEITL